MQPAQGSGEAARSAAVRVASGLLSLIASRFISLPIGILVTAVLARRLGAPDFGAIYLANAGLGLAFLFVDFGTDAQAAAQVAREPASAPRVLGGGIALRLALGALVLLGLPWATRLIGYSDTVRMVFALTAVRCLLVSLGSMIGAIVRGLELIHLHARMTVATSLLEAAFLIPTLYLGGGLHAALLAFIASAACALLVWIVLLVRIGHARVTFTRDAVLPLMHGGLGFVAFDLALKLQPYVDAHFLEKLATPAAIGWYGAANRLMGTLLLPASTLNFAIYPSMARLWSNDREAFARLTRLGLRAVILFGAMAAVGTVAFADVAIGLIYGKAGFGPAVQDLQVLALFVALVYLTFILGCAIVAAQRQLVWAGVQALCIPISVLLDPLLIPRFQAQSGNGGLGVCVTVAIAEVLMVMGALVLIPRGVLTRSLFTDLRRALVAGAAMAGCAFLLRAWPPLSIPLSVVAYFGAQWAQGGIDAELVAQVRGVIAGKLGKARPATPPA